LELECGRSLGHRRQPFEPAPHLAAPPASDPPARLGHVPESKSLWDARRLVNQSFLSLPFQLHMIPSLAALVESFEILSIQEATRHAMPRPLS
jgi:hypothetical protein